MSDILIAFIIKCILYTIIDCSYSVDKIIVRNLDIV